MATTRNAESPTASGMKTSLHYAVPPVSDIESASSRLESVASQKQPVHLPLVSIIVVNYNYGRFLLDAVESAYAQSYPNLEVVIVDDASDDETDSVLKTVADLHPDAKIIRRPENGGQSAASRAGFEASAGDYVVFLDADDLLLRDFVATHVFVHLSLRVPVGFSSADMMQAAGNRIVTGTLQYFSHYVRKQRDKAPDLLRQTDIGAVDSWNFPASTRELQKSIIWVKPSYKSNWVWAPTSGNCFRRDAVSIFMDNDGLANLRTSTDAYLIRGIASMTGSVLIDRPLAIYRVHGANMFSRMAHLNGFLNYDPVDNHDRKARYLAIDLLIDKIDVYGRRAANRYKFVVALMTLNAPLPKSLKVLGCHTYAAAKIIKNFRQVRQVVGVLPLAVYSLPLGIAPWRFLVALCTSVLRPRPAAPPGAESPGI
jgi:glycosyltransferase involved in cell wall biosynthesis